MPTKTVTVDEADRQLTKASEHLTALKAKILDKGPGAVSPEELGDAANAVEHARLTVQHASETAEAEAKQQRLERLEERKARMLAEAGAPDELLDAMRQIEEGTAVIVAYCRRRGIAVDRWVKELREDGVPQLEPNGKVRTDIHGHTHIPYLQPSAEHGDLGWQGEYMGRPSKVIHVGNRKISKTAPGILVGAALYNGARKGNGHPSDLVPQVDVDVSPAVRNDPEAWVRRNC